jgi:hypothetical protein
MGPKQLAEVAWALAQVGALRRCSTGLGVRQAWTSAAGLPCWGTDCLAGTVHPLTVCLVWLVCFQARGCSRLSDLGDQGRPAVLLVTDSSDDA